MQPHTLVRLQPDDQLVRLGGAGGVREHRVRNGFEGDHDLRRAPRHPLAGAQIERHAGPAPVAHLRLDRGESLGTGRRIVGFGGVGRCRRAVHQARGVLACDRAAADIVGGERRERLQHLQLLVADGFASDVGGWLHRNEAEHLQQMVLDHVAQRTCGFVVAAATSDAERLGDGDLYVIDRTGIPQRLQHGVGETCDQQVLHALLAEVVVDPEDLGFGEDLSHSVVDGPRRGEVMADRLLQDDAGPLVDQTSVGQAGTDRTEKLWCAGEIVDPRGTGADVQRLDEFVPPAGVADVDCGVVQPSQKALRYRRVERFGGDESASSPSTLSRYPAVSRPDRDTATILVCSDRRPARSH